MDINSFNLYQINPDKESDLYKNALIFFDTSALLDFYYYSNDTTREIFRKIFKSLKGRLFITSQVEFEYLKNRETVLQKPLNTYDNLVTINKFQKDSGHIERIGEIIKSIKTQINKDLLGQFNTLKEKTSKTDRHPFIDNSIYLEFERKIELLVRYIEGFEKNFQSFCNIIKFQIDTKKQSLAQELIKDNILKQFQKSFEKTKALKYEDIIEIIKEGEIRYRNEIPPGYLDEDDKIGFQKYGDLIIWKEILETAKTKSKDVILIINDLKEDWWHYEKKDYPEGPRYELIKEFNDYTNCYFWMYSINDFLYKSKLYIDTNIKETTIKDVENIVKLWSEKEQQIVLDWLLEYFENEEPNFVQFNPSPAYSGIDYIMGTKNGIYCFQHKSTSKGRYTGLFLPLRTAYLTKDEIKEKFGFDKFVYILESKSKGTAIKLTQHLGRKNPQKILNEKNDDFQLIIAHRENDKIDVLFDSEKKNNNAS